MEFIRFGMLPIEEEYYTTPDGTKIKQVEKLKDLGLIFEANEASKPI